MKRYITAVLTIATLVAAGATHVVFAQTTATVGPGNGFRVSPVREEITVQPGTSQTQDVAVENITNESIVAHPIVNDFVASSDETGQPRLLLDESKPSSGNSFRTLVGTLPDVALQPHERKILKVTVNVPANAAGGGYYGAIRFSPANEGAQKQVSLTASVGVLFLVKVPGQIIEKLDLLTFSGCDTPISSKPHKPIEVTPCSKSHSLFTKSPNDIEIRLSNPGTIHLQPTGRIRIKNWRGKVVVDQEFNNVDPRGNVLPNSIRHFDTVMLSSVKDSDGNYTLAHASFGRYSVEANLGYGTGGGDLITAKTTFWVIPVWFMYLMGALVIAIVAGIFYFRRWRRKQRRYR
jgi:hypothetical protein